MSMKKSTIGYTNEKVPFYWSWEPCGYGCSGGCPTCWARAVAKRAGARGCELCRDFKVHFHPERLQQPAETKKPGVVLTCFHSELWDGGREIDNLFKVLVTAAEVKHHNYVFLTQRPDVLTHIRHKESPHIWEGMTLKRQPGHNGQLDRFLELANQPWLSLEPIMAAIDLRGYFKYGPRYPRGIIIGCDRVKGTRFDLDWVRPIVDLCQSAGVPVYVKQLRINGQLVRDIDAFPPELQVRELPWSMP